MPEYGLSLIRIFSYKDRKLQFCPYMGKYDSEKTRILAYFTSVLVFQVRETDKIFKWNIVFCEQ